jgi:hypothetical protein
MKGRSIRPLATLAAALPLLALSVVASGQTLGGDRPPATHAAPTVLFSEEPAILVLVGGDPVYRPLRGTDLQLLVNTKPFIVRDSAGIHYMKAFDGWMEAYSLTGMWTVAGVPPRGAEEALRRAVKTRTVDLLDGAAPATIFVSLTPAELIVTNGPPRLATIEGTSLQYIENTTANVFKEPTDEELYVLTTRGWFRAWRTDGPWQYVPLSELPADIAAVPASRLKIHASGGVGLYR